MAGASTIENDTLRLLSGILRFENPSPQLIKTTLMKIHSRFSLMANIISLHETVAAHLNNKGLMGLNERIEKYRQEIELDRQNTIQTAAKIIGRYKSIFTLSNSFTVRESILLAAKNGWKGRVSISESRPKCEGILLANLLANKGLQVALGVDALMRQLIHSCSTILLGADCITESFFVNKIGTSIAVEYAQKDEKPVFVLADRAKFVSSRKYKYVPDMNTSIEFARRLSRQLNVQNTYFEKANFVGKLKIITGKSTLDAKEVGEFLKITRNIILPAKTEP
jgi:translation initiation factor 2B subunit (eIF-2B alpha/beta/delta family)